MSKSLDGPGSETSPSWLPPQKVLAASACLAARPCNGVGPCVPAPGHGEQVTLAVAAPSVSKPYRGGANRVSALCGRDQGAALPEWSGQAQLGPQAEDGVGTCPREDPGVRICPSLGDPGIRTVPPYGDLVVYTCPRQNPGFASVLAGTRGRTSSRGQQKGFLR